MQRRVDESSYTQSLIENHCKTLDADSRMCNASSSLRSRSNEKYDLSGNLTNYWLQRCNVIIPENPLLASLRIVL